MALIALGVFILAGAFGATTLNLLNARNPFNDPGSASARAETLVQNATGDEASPGVLALVSAPPGSPAVTSAAGAIAHVPGVATVLAPVPGHDAGLVSKDGRSSLVVVTLRSAPDPNKVVKDVQAALSGRHDVLLGGTDVANLQTNKQAQKDLAFAEAIAFPLLAILAFFIFRGLLAALLPIAVGGMSVLGTFVVLRLVNMALPLSVFALDLVIGLGLGLAVDYSLFLVWRFREELQREDNPEAALRKTLATTGRTVVFSAVTVAAAMATLAIFPERFLVSMGIGGAIVAIVAAASALCIIPPLLMLLRRRISRVASKPEGGGWYRFSKAIMRRPALVALGTVVVLLAIASPTMGVKWSGIDVSVVPTSWSARTVADNLARDFPPASSGNSVTVVATAPASARAALTQYDGRLAKVPGVAQATPPVQVGPSTWEITLFTPPDPISAAGQQVVKDVRAIPAPVPVLVGGPGADFADRGTSIVGNLPLALAVVVILTMLVLWLLTGSLLLPVLALLTNVLTAATATGILVFIFQDGRLTSLLHYTSQGGIEETDFLILAATAFALSTDYGVFLLARVAESRGPGVTEREAIAKGMQRCGRLIQSAAILLAVALGAFVTSQLIFLKEVGVGVAAAVLIDAFIVRTLLVPSLMAVLGRSSWWTPRALRAVHERLPFSEVEAPDEVREVPAAPVPQ